MSQNCQKKTKRARKTKKSDKVRISTTTKRYGIESEIGSLEVEAHELISEGGEIIFRSRDGFLPTVAPKERLRSARYKELQYDFITTNSCRVTAARLNRIRLQNDGGKATTVRNQAEREGSVIQTAKIAKAKAAFQAYGFEADGHIKPETSIKFSESVLKTADNEAVSCAAKELGITAEPNDYEAAENVVNISIDEVSCKHQTSNRPCANREKEPKQVRNTVVHVQKGCQSYVLVGETVLAAVQLLMGFLLANGLLDSSSLVFFADGAKIIKSAVEGYFGFVSYKYILDWPHLTKKSAELLSLAIKGRSKRNEVHKKLKQYLWMGDVSAAIAFLGGLSEDYVKSADWLTKLSAYLERNLDNIPCYAMRQRLGLRISSNPVEKANDRVVSSRQKHNGMSWSKEGSFGMASICATKINREMSDWLHGQSVRFAFESGSEAA